MNQNRNFQTTMVNQNRNGNLTNITFDQNALFSDDFQFQNIPAQTRLHVQQMNVPMQGHIPVQNQRNKFNEFDPNAFNYPQSVSQRDDKAFSLATEYREQLSDLNQRSQFEGPVKKQQIHEMQMLQNQIINQSGNIIRNLNIPPQEELINPMINIPVQNMRTRPPVNAPFNNPMMSINNYYDENLSKSNAPQFLEDPLYIVTKNLFNQGWFLMTENNKILANFNSLELLGFLEEEIRAGNNLQNVWLTDYETDMFFSPIVLYDILRENIPRIMETVKRQRSAERNQQRMQNIHQGSREGMQPRNMPYGNKFDMQQVRPQRNDMEDSMHNGRVMNRQTEFHQGQPLNMNINLQFVQNDINLNNYNMNRDHNIYNQSLGQNVNRTMKPPSRAPSSQGGEVDYTNLFNTSLSSDFKNNKNANK